MERIQDIEKHQLGKNKPRDGREEARIYIGHWEYIACHILRVG